MSKTHMEGQKEEDTHKKGKIAYKKGAVTPAFWGKEDFSKCFFIINMDPP